MERRPLPSGRATGHSSEGLGAQKVLLGSPSLFKFISRNRLQHKGPSASCVGRHVTGAPSLPLFQTLRSPEQPFGALLPTPRVSSCLQHTGTSSGCFRSSSSSGVVNRRSSSVSTSISGRGSAAVPRLMDLTRRRRVGRC